MERSAEIDDLLPDLAMAKVLQQRPLGIVSLRHAVRVALAVTVSWAVADLVSHSALPLFAPVTTLLVVQTTPWTTLGISVQRILGTGIGVLAASIWVNLVGLSWWSFAIGVLAALLVARQLPWSLGGQLQIPVAVVFVLALGPGTLSADLWRVADVAIGGAIGLAAVFIYPERPKPAAFERAMREYRDAILDVLHRVAAESGTLAAPLPEGAFHDYVIVSRRFRDRGVTQGLTERGLRLRRLAGIAIQVRGIVGAANRLYDRADLSPRLTPERFAALVGRLAELARATLGAPDDDVRGTDRERATSLGHELEEELEGVAAELIRDANPDESVLHSVSLLGRLDHVRAQLVGFPGWQDDVPLGGDENLR